MLKSKLKFVLCPGSHPRQEYQEIYNQIYNRWYSLWSEAYIEMKFEKKLYSDAFTRQDYVGAIFYENKCLALCCFRWADFKSPDFCIDSYFSYWNEDDIKVLTKYGSNIIMATQFTIDPMVRKGQVDFSMKDLLMGMTTELMLHSFANGMAANLRVNKKMNDCCVRWGGDLIRSNVLVSPGIYGDLMVFSKEKISQRETLDLEKDVINLWNQRIVIPRMYSSEEDYFITRKLKAA